MPPRARALQEVEAIAYDDTFAAATPRAAEHAPRAWARAVFEEAPAWFRATLLGVWRVCQVRLGPLESDRHVLGWEIVSEHDDAVVLGARSTLGVTLQLVVLVEAGRVAVASFVTFDRLAGRVAFSSIAPAHRLTLAYLVGRAASCGPRRPAG